LLDFFVHLLDSPVKVGQVFSLSFEQVAESRAQAVVWVFSEPRQGPAEWVDALRYDQPVFG
jgi:hypothetical protein